MLISKIRSKSSREFISIMDQVIISEFDALNDQILENRDSISVITESVLSHYHENKGRLLNECVVSFPDDTLASHGDARADELQTIMDLYKTDLVNHVVARLESAILDNHEIFRGLQ